MMATRAERLADNATRCLSFTKGGRTLLTLVGDVKLLGLQRIEFHEAAPCDAEIRDAPEVLDPGSDDLGTELPDLDEAWQMLEAIEGPASLLDLRALEYIELPALLYLNGLFAVDRSLPADMRPRTAVLLPTDPDVLRFLLRWNYLNAFADAVGAGSINDVIVGDSHNYQQRAAEIASLVEYTTDPRGQKVQLLPRRYYEVKSFLHPQSLSIDLAEDVAAAWCEPHVLDVLNKMMGPTLGPWVAHNVIMQLLENALIHPHATVIQHCAQHERRTYLPLKVALWDNGESIITTLRNGLKDGSVVGPGSEIADVDVEVHLKVRDERGVATVTAPFHLTKDDLRPREEHEDWKILLSALMPGVSGRTRLGGVGDMLGLGLHRIAYSTTRSYGGEFIIRTRDVLIVVRPALDDPSASYAVDVEVLAQTAAPLQLSGNLLAVSLPPKWM